MPHPIEGSVKQKRDRICLLVVPVVYDREIHCPLIKTNAVSLANKERTMPSNCSHMNTQSKSSIVVGTIKEGIKILRSRHVFYFVNKTDNRNATVSTISNNLHKQKGYTFEESSHAHRHSSTSQHSRP